MEVTESRRQDDPEGRRHHGPEGSTSRNRSQRGSSRRPPRRRSASCSWTSPANDNRKGRALGNPYTRKSRNERRSSSSEDYLRRKRKRMARRSRSLSRSRNRPYSSSGFPARRRRADWRRDNRLGNREVDKHHAEYQSRQLHYSDKYHDCDRRRQSRFLSSGRHPRRNPRHGRSRRSRSFSSSKPHSSSSPRRPRQRAADILTRAGVVSDDDDANLAVHKCGPGVPGGAVKQQPGRPEGNMRQNPMKMKRRNHSSHSSSAAHENTEGHFWGGPGTVIADRYRVERELGVGTFGRVVECFDLRKIEGRSPWQPQREGKNSRNNLVAIKMVRKVKRYYESALIEADIVSDVNRRGGPRGRGTSHFAVMYEAFNFRGHYCLVFESLGPSLYDYLRRNKYQPFPMRCVRDFSKQLLEAIEFMHSFRLIHTDLKPENILLTKCREVSRGKKKLPESTRIKVIDFGGATYDDERKSSVVNTRQYRAPEVILNCGWSMPSDLWSAGCILCELYTGELLFATHDDLEHLGLIEQVIGPFPRQMLRRANHFDSTLANQAFDNNGRHQLDRVLSRESVSYVLKMPPLESIVTKKEAWFLKLLRSILVIDPENRSSARDALQNGLGERPL